MTIRVTCDGDGCGKQIDREIDSWFGLDYSTPPEPIIVDGEDTGMTELKQLGMDHEFHCCSPDCVVSWAFSRAFTPQPEGTTT
jgi:hypothetical protein